MIFPQIRPDEPGTNPGDPGNGRVLVIDECTQKFNGITYYKYPSSDRYFAKVKGKNLALNIEVWAFHNGRPPEGYKVHHDHRNPDGSFDADENNIEWLRLMTAPEHTAYHFEHRVPYDKVCAWCEKPFQTKHAKEMYCSNECRIKARRLQARMKYRAARSAQIANGETYSDSKRSRGAKSVVANNLPEHCIEVRECPLCGDPFRVDKYSGAVVCSKPDCVSKAIKMELARKRIQKNRLERNGGIKLFTNKELGVKIRCLLIDGVPWFVGRDVAKALGYKDTINAIKVHVEPEDKQKIDLTKVDLARVADHHPCSDATFKPASLTTIINLAGLVSLISDSELPTAKAIKYWLFHTVLPKLMEMNMYQLVPPTSSTSPAIDAPTIDV